MDIAVTVPVDGRPYYFRIKGEFINGSPFIEQVCTDTGYPEDDHDIPYVMLVWKEDMFNAIREAHEKDCSTSSAKR